MSHIFLIEDNYNTRLLRSVYGDSDDLQKQVKVRLHYIDDNKPKVIAEQSYSTERSSRSQQKQKANIALDLLDRLKPCPIQAMIVANSVYGRTQHFIRGIQSRHFGFTVQIRASTNVTLNSDSPHCISVKEVLVSSLLNSKVKWVEFPIVEYSSGQVISYSVADLASILLPDGSAGRLVVAQRGNILEISSNTMFALSSAWELGLKDLIQAVGWVRLLYCGEGWGDSRELG